MKNIKKIFIWVINNKEWVFSGIGVTVLTLLLNGYNI